MICFGLSRDHLHGIFREAALVLNSRQALLLQGHFQNAILYESSGAIMPRVDSENRPSPKSIGAFR
jgi:hypothetical protein